MAKTTSKKSASKNSSSNSKSKSASKSSGSRSGSSSSSRSGSASKASPKKAAAKKAAAKSASKASSGRSNATASRVKAASRGASSRARSAQPMNETGMFEELFLESLKDIYWAEKHLLKALPRMRKAATSQDLQQAFDNHTSQTQEQVQRLEQVFEALGKKSQGKKCEAMDGLTKEAESVISETQKGSMTRDVGLIMAAQKVEHYEIATYGSLATLAATMGNQQIKQLLGQTLEEEKQTDELLTQIAESHINQQAAQNESNEGGEGGGQSASKNGEQDEEGDEE